MMPEYLSVKRVVNMFNYLIKKGGCYEFFIEKNYAGH